GAAAEEYKNRGAPFPLLWAAHVDGRAGGGPRTGAGPLPAGGVAAAAASPHVDGSVTAPVEPGPTRDRRVPARDAAWPSSRGTPVPGVRGRARRRRPWPRAEALHRADRFLPDRARSG